MSQVEQLLAQADGLRRARQVREAEAACRQAIALDAAHPGALRLLGELLMQQSRWDEAVAALQRAWQLRPGAVDIGVRLRDALAGKHIAAGLQLAQAGHLDDAAVCFRRALEANPEHAQAHLNLGVTLEQLGKFEGAVAGFRRALQIKPDYVQALHNLGTALQKLEQYDESINCFRRALALNSNFVDSYEGLGVSLEGKRQFAEAEACFRRAIAMRPDFAPSHSNLAGVLEHQGRMEEALASLRRSLELDPRSIEAHNNVGHLLRRLNRVDEAIDWLRRAVSIAPDAALVHMNYGMALLTAGRWTEGWREYEWRLESDDLRHEQKLKEPKWTGQPLAGKTILLRGEQGFGDSMQFVRYARLVKQRGARVIVACRPPLAALLARAPGVDAVITPGDSIGPIDYWQNLPSLPLVFETVEATIPADVPYLLPEPGLVEKWQARFADERRLKVGIAWHGDPGNKANHHRSFPLEQLAGVSRIPGVQLYSLQVGAGREELAPASFAAGVIDLADKLGDFHNTAAIVRNLDLVITCDSAPAHLAGGLGLPGWVALEFSPDWRWMLSRDDTPWYPTLRLFRQARAGDWPSVFERVEQELSRMAAARQA